MLKNTVLIALAVLFFGAGTFAVVKHRESVAAKHLMLIEKERSRRLESDATMERRTFEELYRRCQQENVLIKEQLEHCR